MKCENCNAPATVRYGARYQYKECGLDRVYLDNIKVIECGECGAESPRIPRLIELHKTLGKAIALQPAPLTGIDVRLLRKQLGIKARDWAAMIGVDPATLSRWENGEQQIGTQSDLLVRFLYVRLREEREGQPLAGVQAEQITKAARAETTVAPSVFIDASAVSRYAYQ